MALTEVNSTSIKDGTIVNADVNASAAIAGTKISPDFGSQDVDTTGNILLDSDTNKLKIGDGEELQIYHDGTNSYISNTGGILHIKDDDVRIQSEASETMIRGVGNGAVELYYDNVKTCQTIGDGIRVEGTEGSHGKLEIFADEGDENADKWQFLAHTGGAFQLQNFTSGAWENNISATGNGSVELMYDNSKKLETTSAGATVSGNQIITGSGGDTTHLQINNATDTDGVKLLYSSGSGLASLQVTESGSGFQVACGGANAGNRRFQAYSDTTATVLPYGDENMGVFTPNGAVELYYNNNLAFKTDTNGVQVLGTEGNDAYIFIFPDEADDLADQWRIRGWQASQTLTIESRNASGSYETNIECNGDGSVELFYDNSKKFETTSAGANLTGELGINVSSPQNPLHVRNSADNPTDIRIQRGAGNTDNGSAYASIIFDGHSYCGAKIASHRDHSTYDDRGDLRFYSGYGNDDFTMRILMRNDGDVIIGGTSYGAAGALSISPSHDDGAPRVVFNRADTSAWSDVILFQNNTGTKGYIKHDDSEVDYYSASDYRLKENDVAITDGITRVKQLRPIKFNWKVKDASETQDGFFAHEVQSVVPNAVDGVKDAVDDDGNVISQMLQESKIIPVLTAALKEAIAKIETLETKVAALEG